MTKAKRKCLGYGPYEGKCDNPAGSPWSDYWCLRCDKLRLETIKRKLETIVQSFGRDRQGG